MNWKNMMNKKCWIFRQGELAESRSCLENPARGWYGIYTFPVQETINPEELRWSLREGESLVLVLLDIYKYRSMPLDETALNSIRDILSFFVHYKKDVILRPVYDREGNGRECEPDTFELMLEHIKQIGKILSDMKHSVFIFQGMLVGSWGEMHDSRYLLPEYMKQIWKCMQQCCGNDMYLAVRTPAQWRTLRNEKEFGQKEYAGLTLFDDGILGSMTHLGTFGTMTREAAGWAQAWMRKEEIEFISCLTAEVPCGGEVTSCIEEDSRMYEAEFIINELRSMHLTYLDSTYDRKVLDLWKTISWNCPDDSEIWQNCSLYEYIEGHLGYRLTVTNAEMRPLRRGKAEFVIEIENTGFGKMFQETELFLTVENENEIRVVSVSINLREIQAGSRKCGKAVIDLMEGRVFLKLQRKKDGRIIRFANKYSADNLYLGSLHRGIVHLTEE